MFSKISIVFASISVASACISGYFCFDSYNKIERNQLDRHLRYMKERNEDIRQNII